MSAAPLPGSRLQALDALRGLIMIVMALDHASFFVAQQHFGEPWGLPLPDYGSGFALWTRVVTHLCAPGFFLLMGAGMALFATSRRERGWSETRITRHFLVRGAVLIVVEMLIVNPAWLLGILDSAGSVEEVSGPPFPGGGGLPYLNFGVLSSLGASMMVAGLVVRLGAVWQILLGAGVLLAGQALLPSADQVAVLFPAWQRVLLIAGQTGPVMVAYPITPWVGVCMFGIAIGSTLRQDAAQKLAMAMPLGVLALVGFCAVRIAGGFGNHHPMPSNDWMGLLSVTKYPPSLAFLMLSLGANGLLLGLLAKVSPCRWLDWLWVYGRAPLFFYVVHLYLFALIGLAIPGETTLLGMYPFWILGVVALYPACRRYQQFKNTKSEESLWRLF